MKEKELRKAILADIKKTLKGGAGSGFYSHAGRPGKLGGSSPGKGTGLTPKDFLSWVKNNYIGKKPLNRTDFEDMHAQWARETHGGHGDTVGCRTAFLREYDALHLTPEDDRQM